MFNFKDKNKLHCSLKNYSFDYILNNETMITDLRINNHSYFYTNKRIIVFQGESIFLNSNKVESFFYDDISSVKYGSYLLDSNKYATLDFNFIIPNKKLILDFPEDLLFDISNKIDSFIA